MTKAKANLIARRTTYIFTDIHLIDGGPTRSWQKLMGVPIFCPPQRSVRQPLFILADA